MTKNQKDGGYDQSLLCKWLWRLNDGKKLSGKQCRGDKWKRVEVIYGR